MDFIDKIKIRLHYYYLDKALKINKSTNHYSMDYDSTQSIGILFDASQIEYREAVEQFIDHLRRRGKKVKALGYINEKQKQAFFAFQHFSNKELDFALRPKEEEILDFQNENFDILFNLYFGSPYPLQYISALSKATFRVGPSTEQTYCYDLMLQTNKDKDLHHFISQAESLLKKMNQKYEATAVLRNRGSTCHTFQKRQD